MEPKRSDSLVHPEAGSHPASAYRVALGRHDAVASALEARTRRVEVARLVTFLVGAVVGLLHDDLPVPATLTVPIAALAGLAFVILVSRHRSLRARLRRARLAASLARLGLARLERDWQAVRIELEEIGAVDPLLAPGASSEEEHPYVVDLDVFGPGSVRALLGPAPTPSGTETLRRWLRDPAPADEVRSRQAAVAALAADFDGREALTVEALLVDPVDRAAWKGFLRWTNGASPFARGHGAGLPGWSIGFARAAPPVTLGLFLFWTFSVGVPALVWVVPLGIQGALAFRWGKVLSQYFESAGARSPGLRRHHALFAAWEAHDDADDGRLRALRARLGVESGPRASREIRVLERWLDLAGSHGSMVHQVLTVVFLWDVHVAVGLEGWRARSGARVAGWFDALGELEALSALAVLSHDHPDWCFPQMREGTPGLEAEALGHPLISDALRRTSDVRLEPPGRFLLVTGSNMSGKSTLLRSLGLCAVLGQAGSVVCARAASMTPLRTFTSMRIHDSLTGGVSLFMAELLRLKALVDAADAGDAQRGDPALLWLIDEVLQGTNSEERRVAARRILRHLLAAHAIGAVTTHDLALHEEPTLDAASTKVHFREDVDDTAEQVLSFDYRLRPGLATSRNALRLLRIVGLQDGEPEAGELP